MYTLLVGFFVYFFIIGWIAFAASYKKGKVSGYSTVILGNRSIGYVLTALSAHASDMSDWLFMAFPATLYAGGLVNAWIAVGLVGGMWLTWQYIAPGIRTMTEKYDSLTLSTYFERRFADSSGVIRMLSALISIFFFAVYIAAGFKGFGFLAQSVFQLPYLVGTSVAMGCAVLYILFGGYKSLAWIDCFQASFLLLVIFFVPFMGYMHVGGWEAIIQAADMKNIPLTFLPDTLPTFINRLSLAISWGVGYFGTPHILTKFMGISHPKEIVKAQYIGMTWQVSVLFAAGLSGLIGIAYFPSSLVNKELVFIEMVKGLCTPLATGFVLSAVAGATLSVITAQVLVLVSVITEDLYKGTLRKRAQEKELLWVYRLSIVLVVLLGFIVSLDKERSIQSLVHYAWMGFGCSFGPLVLLSLHSTKINKYGAWVCMAGGAGVAALWQITAHPFFFDRYALIIPAVIPGFCLSIVSAYIVSALTDHRIRKKQYIITSRGKEQRDS